MILVTDKRQNVTGFWGPVDTTASFCENHYSTSPYFAEFFNAWTSFIYVIVGVYLIGKFSQHVWIPIAALWLVLIGFGSFAYHATMRYSMQLVDELPMVGFIVTLIVAKTTSKDHEGIQKYSTWIQIWVITQALALVALYLYYELYQVFLDGFTILVIHDAVVGYLLTSRGAHLQMKRTVQICAILFIILGRIVWEAENQLCAKYQSLVWPLHTIWHFLSAASAYNSCIFIHLCKIGEADQIPALVGYSRIKVKMDKES